MVDVAVADVEPGASGAEQGIVVGDRVAGLNEVPISPTFTFAEFATLLKACRPTPSAPAVIGNTRQRQRQRHHGRPGAGDPARATPALGSS